MESKTRHAEVLSAVAHAVDTYDPGQGKKGMKIDSQGGVSPNVKPQLCMILLRSFLARKQKARTRQTLEARGRGRRTAAAQRARTKARLEELVNGDYYDDASGVKLEGTRAAEARRKEIEYFRRMGGVHEGATRCVLEQNRKRTNSITVGLC